MAGFGGVKVTLFLTIIVSSPDAERHNANQQEAQRQNYNSSNCTDLCGRIWSQNRTLTLWVISHWYNSSSSAVGSGRLFMTFRIFLISDSTLPSHLFISTNLSVKTENTTEPRNPGGKITATVKKYF